MFISIHCIKHSALLCAIPCKFSRGKNQTIQNVESASSPYISDAIPVGFSPLYTHSTCACTVRVQRSKLANYYAWGYRKNQFAPRNTFFVLLMSRFSSISLPLFFFLLSALFHFVLKTFRELFAWQANVILWLRFSKLKIFPLINRKNKLCYFTNGR